MIPGSMTVSTQEDVLLPFCSAALQADGRRVEIRVASDQTPSARLGNYANSFILTGTFGVPHTRPSISLIAVTDSPADSLTFLTLAKHEIGSQYSGWKDF
jgi:hypothetical protein